MSWPREEPWPSAITLPSHTETAMEAWVSFLEPKVSQRMIYFNFREGSTKWRGSTPWPISTWSSAGLFLWRTLRAETATPIQAPGRGLLFLPEIQFKSPEVTPIPASKMRYTWGLFHYIGWKMFSLAVIPFPSPIKQNLIGSGQKFYASQILFKTTTILFLAKEEGLSLNLEAWAFLEMKILCT